MNSDQQNVFAQRNSCYLCKDSSNRDGVGIHYSSDRTGNLWDWETLLLNLHIESEPKESWSAGVLGNTQNKW